MVKFWLASVVALACASVQAQVGIIARLQPNANIPVLEATYNIRLTDQAVGGPFYYFQFQNQFEKAALIAALNQNPQVVWAEDDEGLSVLGSTNGKGGSIPQLRANDLRAQYSVGTAYNENSAWLQQIGWNYQAPQSTDRPIRVAILDTGLSPLQPELWTRVVEAKTFVRRETRPWDLRSNTVAPNKFIDPNGALGHGTMVAGIINQLAPDAQFIIARVADSAGFSTSWQTIKGMVYAVANGAELVNLSMGSEANLVAMNDVLDWMDEQNVLVIAAAGNLSRDRAFQPARNSGVVCVTAVDENDKKAFFANWDSKVDLSAPGTGIKSSYWNGNMAVQSGTSMAAPVVTGCLAEALKSRPRLPIMFLRPRVENAGVSIDGLNPQYEGEIGRRIQMGILRQRINAP
jgi:subtilisin family serine protease